MQSGPSTFWGRFCLLSWSNARKEYFFPIYPCKITNGFLWNGKTRVTQNGCVVSALFFQVEHVTRAPSPLSPFHSSMSLLLQFSHRLSCVVVVYLVPATIYGQLLNGVGGRFPIWEGRGVVPGSTGVLRVVCPWVRCRTPPEFSRPSRFTPCSKPISFVLRPRRPHSSGARDGLPFRWNGLSHSGHGDIFRGGICREYVLIRSDFPTIFQW